MTGSKPTVAAVFDRVAETYDQTGVSFFRPVGETLVDLLVPQPGERALDIGCGRGAATVPLARAVGGAGRVDAIDVSPAMVAALGSVLEAEGLDNVRARVADARVIATDDAYDVIAASLVLFFLAEPTEVLAGWVDLLAPGGRIGLTTFGPLDAATTELDDLLVHFQPPGLLDPRTSGTNSPFASDEGMADLLRNAGTVSVETVVKTSVLEFPDVETWHAFSMATGQRAMWMNVPEDERPGILEQAAAILDRTRDGGPARLEWQMRYTCGRA